MDMSMKACIAFIPSTTFLSLLNLTRYLSFPLDSFVLWNEAFLKTDAPPSIVSHPLFVMCCFTWTHSLKLEDCEWCSLMSNFLFFSLFRRAFFLVLLVFSLIWIKVDADGEFQSCVVSNVVELVWWGIFDWIGYPGKLEDLSKEKDSGRRDITVALESLKNIDCDATSEREWHDQEAHIEEECEHEVHGVHEEVIWMRHLWKSDW